MSKKAFGSLIVGLLFCLLLSGLSAGQTEGSTIFQSFSADGLGHMGLQGPNPARSPSDYEFSYLKQSVGVWADGKGDVLLEQHITNISPEPLDSLTWWFEWPAADYTNIHAVDSVGPLIVERETDGNVIFVTVVFRKPLQQNKNYEFKLSITIGGMTSGSGNNWTANWYTAGDQGVKIFEEVVAFPANATVTSVSPPATERHGNIITWKLYNQSDWTLAINVPYVLSANIDVPLFLQSAPPWGDDIYAFNSAPADNMSRWGCLTTSGAMIVNYLAGTQDLSSSTDPGALNAWLTGNNGYTEKNGVKHAWLGKYARSRDPGIAMYWNESNGYNPARLTYYLRSGYPAILGVKPTVIDGKTVPGHYVVATGTTTVNGTATYTINDPAYGQTTLYDKWNNQALTMILFSASEANQELLYFAAQSPIEFVVIDPVGRRSGYDPTTQTVWEEIPGAYYLYEGLSAEDGSDAPIYMKTLSVPDPLDGEYQTIVYGTGAGAYTMEVTSMDWQGISQNNVFSGVTAAGETHTYTVDYSEVINLLYLPSVLDR